MLKGTMTQKILKPETKQAATLTLKEDAVVEVFGNYRGGKYDPYDPIDWMEYEEDETIHVNILGTFKETKPHKGTHTVLQCELIEGGYIAEFPKHLVSVKKVQKKLKAVPIRLMPKNPKNRQKV